MRPRCVTCSDEGVPMRVDAVGPDSLAACRDNAGAEHTVDVELVEPIVPGDRVLVHAGVAIGRVGAGG